MKSADAAAAELGPVVRRYLRRYCGDPDVAEDIAQEALLRVTRALASFDGRSNLKTWALAIATRAASDHYRREKRSIREVAVDEDALPADDAPAVLRSIINEQMNRCVRETIDTLPDIYRAAIVLRDLEGLSLAEVAEICNCSLATAKIRVHRARRRAQQALSDSCDFYTDDDNVLRCDRKQRGSS